DPDLITLPNGPSTGHTVDANDHPRPGIDPAPPPDPDAEHSVCRWTKGFVRGGFSEGWQFAKQLLKALVSWGLWPLVEKGWAMWETWKDPNGDMIGEHCPVVSETLRTQEKMSKARELDKRGKPGAGDELHGEACGEYVVDLIGYAIMLRFIFG